MLCEYFNEVEILGEHLTSEKCKGSVSSYVSAFWANIGGRIDPNTEQLQIGLVKYYFIHDLTLLSSTDATKRCRVRHVFAKMNWLRTHPREAYLPSPLFIVNSDFETSGPATFLPVSRILSRCAVAHDTIEFDYGEDSVIIASPLRRRLNV